MQDRGHLLTEQRNPRSQGLDRMSIGEAFDVMNAEDAAVAKAVADAKPQICDAIALVVAAFRSGGRLIYVGAGTSGRLGVLDASECPPTFLSDPHMVQGVIAGGESALRRSIEGSEDSADDGAKAVDQMNVEANDVVIGITTGGTTPFVHGALARARQRGACTLFLACVAEDHVAAEADVVIRVLVGPEVVTGSTRLKAGTATKMVLNMITTLSMVGIGKVYENFMVDVNTRGSRKLLDRGIRIVRTLTGIGAENAQRLLEQADGRVKTAIVMQRLGLDRPAAEQLLEKNAGHLRISLGE